jgi:hypothetical protein
MVEILQEKANKILEKTQSIIKGDFEENKRFKLLRRVIDFIIPFSRETVIKSIVFITIVIVLFCYYALNYTILKKYSYDLFEYINLIFMIFLIYSIIKIYYCSPSNDYDYKMILSIKRLYGEFDKLVENCLEAEYLCKILKDRQGYRASLNNLSTIFIFILLIFCNIFVSNFKDNEIASYMLGWILVLGIILGVMNIFIAYKEYIYKLAVAALTQYIYSQKNRA